MKFCFIGTGSIGKRHIKNCVSVCKERGERAQIHVLRHSKSPLPEELAGVVSKQIYSVEEMDEWYDAIFITNPTHKHYETILNTKDKSRCFFVEKPLFDREDISLVKMDLPKENVYYIACPLRYTGVLRKVKDMLEGEQICSVRAISSSYLPDWRKGTDYRTTYSAHKDQGGGVCIDLIHEWDYLTSFFGFPSRVKSMCGKYSALEIDSEDLAVYIAEYDKWLLELHLDYLGRVVRRQMEVRTAEHEFVFDIARSRIMRDDEIVQSFDEEPNDKYIEEMKTFFAIMNGQEENPNSMEHAMKVMQITNGR